MAEGQGKELWVQDLSAVSENILLAAHAMGLGACWTTIYPIQNKVNGMKVSKAATVQVDGVTGATFSSKAVKENVKRGIAYYQKHK